MIGRKAMAMEFSATRYVALLPAQRFDNAGEPRIPARISPPISPNWRLRVDGLVQRPLDLSLDALRSLPQRTQITRHDCVEGWSAIGQWTGPQLSHILHAAGLRDSARYIVFYCADGEGGRPYYELIDLDDAFHPRPSWLIA